MTRFLSRLRVRLILIVMFAVIPALLLTLYTGLEHRQTVATAAQREALQLALFASADQDQLIESTRQLLAGLARLPEVRQDNTAVCSAFFADLLEQYPLYAGLGVVKPNGDLWCSATPISGQVNYADRAWFQETLRTRDFTFGGYVMGRSLRKPIGTFAYPILDERGEVLALTTAALDLAWLNQFVAQTQLPAGSVLTVVDNRGTVLARNVEPEKWVGQTATEAPIIQEVLARTGQGTVESTGLDGVNRLYAFAPLGSASQAGNVYVYFGIPTAIAYAQADQTLTRNLMALGLVTLFALLAAWGVGERTVVRQVSALIATTRRIASGDLSARTGRARGTAEIVQLARAFDEMADSLEQRTAQLLRANRALRTISECNQVLVRATDEAELLHQVCRAIVEIGGYRLVWVGYAESDERKTVRPVAQAGFEAGYLETLDLTWADTERGREPAGRAIRTGQPALAKDILNDPDFAPWRAQALERGYTSSMALPLIGSGQPFGALSLYAAESDAFDAEETKLLSELANDLAYGVTALRTRAERELAEEALRYRAEMDRLISAISTNFIYLAGDELDDGIHRALEAIGAFAGVDRSYVFLLYDDGTQMDNTHEWCAGGIEPQIDRLKGLPAEMFPWWMERLRRFQTIRISRVSDLPAEASAEKDILQAQGIQSVMVVPMLYGQSLVGFLGFDAVRVEKAWRDEEEALLKLAAEIFMNAWGRQQAQTALEHERASLAQRVEERTLELSIANAELARANRLKDEFLANMSHELRTPLNAILGLSEALLEQTRGPLNEHQLRSLRTVHGSGYHLLDLINDILDLSKIEAGRLELQLDWVPVEPLCQASLLFVKQVAHKKRISVSLTLADKSLGVQVDTRRLKQILVNLLSNAVKFTPEGGQVGLEVATDDKRQVVCFTVWDTGIGIAQEDIARLFKPFVQVDSSLSRQQEGTGLGLALVSRLAELHGGSVAVESDDVPGRGSRFTVTLPWQRPPKAVEAGRPAEAVPEATVVQHAPVVEDTPPRPGAEPPLVLLAEDNEATLFAMVDYLEDKGYRVVVARHGAEAIDRARQERPALILMDAQMPVMDGLEATRRIRADPELAGIPIIALTALAMRGDRERFLAAGATDHLTKPVSLNVLIQAIEAQLA